jgi:hypothetical protein
MFSWLTKRFRPRQIEDPVFGALLFMKMKDPSLS